MLTFTAEATVQDRTGRLAAASASQALAQVAPATGEEAGMRAGADLADASRAIRSHHNQSV